MKTRQRRRLPVGAACLLAIAAATAQADWPNFRGPNHDGISAESGLKTEWSGAIPLVWDRQIGSSYSSFACVGDAVYTCGTQGEQQVLFRLDADTGNVVWQVPIEPEFRNSYGDGTRATPTVNDGRVYILGAHGRLLCVNASDGTEVWSRSFSHKPQWGYSGSVLIEGDLAIATGGKSDGSLAAFDKKTGRPVWKCGDDPAGYATPYPFTFEGRRYVVGFTGSSVLIADARTGRQVWRTAWETAWEVNASSPIYHEGHLFLSSGYRTGCGLFKLRTDGDNLAADSVWKSKVLLNKFQSCILLDGKLYGSDQKALKCVDFMTGTEHWRKSRIKHSTLNLAENYLYLLTEKGKLQIAKASPQDFTPVTTADILTGKCWTVSALHRGRLYARNLGSRVVCYNLKP